MGNVAVDSTAVNGTAAAQSKRAENVRVYSEDKNIWEGMTVKDAYEKGNNVLTIFNGADIDGDGVISKNELQRYDGPIYTIEKEVDGDKIEATFKGTTAGGGVVVTGGGIGIATGGGTTEGAVSGNLKKTIKQEFYPGLDISDVKSWARDKYQEFDVAPRDGVLSKKEMKLYESKLYELNEKIKKQKVKVEDAKDRLPSGILTGMFGVVSCLASAYHSLEGQELAFCSYRGLISQKTHRILGKTALVVGLGALAIGAIKYFCSNNELNENVKKEEQILNNLKNEKNIMMKS